MPAETFNVVVQLRGYGTHDEIAARVRQCLETHPTLSLRVDEVYALVVIDGGVVATGDGLTTGVLQPVQSRTVGEK